MKRGATIFLKGVILLIGIVTLTLYLFCVPDIASSDVKMNPGSAYLQYPFLLAAYALALPFFIALYQAFKLLIYIDKNNTFSQLSVGALKVIKFCAIIISAFIVGGTLFVAVFLDGDRAGIMALGLYFTFASSVIATFAGVLQHLVKEVVDIISENELIV
ncbi:DUF2975 domain-containing protein [Lysinibacillus sp. FSL W8-0992]|uniref:DUF2975 domain-containing protein n=1 Tax=Lysinibacillus sp. FSL W8-0992 TaxID=2954643 RepID=UPI0030FA3E96